MAAGLLLITFCGIAVILFKGRTRVPETAATGFGIGLALALDEWVYLMMTDGSNASSLLPISLRGGVVMISLAVLYIALLYLFNRR